MESHNNTKTRYVIYENKVDELIKEIYNKYNNNVDIYRERVEYNNKREGIALTCENIDKHKLNLLSFQTLLEQGNIFSFVTPVKIEEKGLLKNIAIVYKGKDNKVHMNFTYEEINGMPDSDKEKMNNFLSALEEIASKYQMN